MWSTTPTPTASPDPVPTASPTPQPTPVATVQLVAGKTATVKLKESRASLPKISREGTKVALALTSTRVSAATTLKRS